MVWLRLWFVVVRLWSSCGSPGCTGAKAGRHVEPAEKACALRPSASLPPWRWVPAHSEAQHE